MGALHMLMDPSALMAQFGSAFWWVAHVIVLVECGLFFPILPGDSLLFAIGMFTRSGDLHVPLLVSMLTLTGAAFVGNVMGYEIGRAIGPRLYERDGRIVKRAHLERTADFFARWGRQALVLGRFVPIVRTFVTVVAGVGRMPRREFLLWSGVGAVAWVIAVTGGGWLLGSVPFVRAHLEAMVLGLVALSVLPLVVGGIRQRLGVRHEARIAAHEG